MEKKGITYNVRRAEERDFDALWEMELEMRESQKEMSIELQTREAQRQDLFGKTPKAWVLILEISDAEEKNNVHAVGYTICYYGYSARYRKRTFVEDIFVKEKYRRAGYGRALMNEIIKVSEKESSHAILLECYPWNESAMQYYKSFGFQECKTKLLGLHMETLRKIDVKSF